MSLNPTPLQTKPSWTETARAMHELYRKHMPGVPSIVMDGSPANTNRLRLWQQLIMCGFNQQQVEWVLDYVANGVRNRGWSERNLELRNICNPETFEEHLSLSHYKAKHMEGRSCVPSKARHVRGYGSKVDTVPAEPTTPRHLIPGLAKSWAAELRKELGK